MKVAETQEHRNGRVEVAGLVKNHPILTGDQKIGVLKAMTQYEKALRPLDEEGLTYWGGVVDGMLWAFGIDPPGGGLKL